MSRTTPENIEKIRQKAIEMGHDGPFLDDNVACLCDVFWAAIDIHKGRDSTQLALRKQGKLIKNRSGTQQEHANLLSSTNDQLPNSRLRGSEDFTHES